MSPENFKRVRKKLIKYADIYLSNHKPKPINMKNVRQFYWKNVNGKFNYHLRADNGKVLEGTNQGYNRMPDMIKTISAVARFYGAQIGMLSELHFIKNPKSKTIIKTITITV